MGEVEDVKPQLVKAFTDIRAAYDLLDEMYIGPHNRVYRAVGHQGQHGGLPVAVKVIPKRRKGAVHATREELSILRDSVHSNVVKCYDVQESELEVFLVFELLSGGSLQDRIVGGRILTEQMASNVFRQVLWAVAHLHQHRVVHRDLRPHNLLFASDAPHCPVKVADFGSAARLKKDEPLDKQVGVAKYMSPEMAAKREYGLPTDLWSLGVVLYNTLSGGQEPFTGQGPVLFEAIRAARVPLVAPPWDGISATAKDLISQLLCKDAAKRLTASDGLRHRWVAREKDRWMAYTLMDNSLAPPRRRPFTPKRLFIGAVQAVVFAHVLARRPRPALHLLRRLSLPTDSRTPLDGPNTSSPSIAKTMIRIAPGRPRPSPMRQASHRLRECSACGHTVSMDEGLEVGEAIFHAGCFLCGACGQAISGSFVEGPGVVPYHAECVPALYHSNKPQVVFCYVCSNPCMAGITALGRTYHDKCFMCASCRLPITEEGNYEELSYEPYHHTCLEKLKLQNPTYRGSKTVLGEFRRQSFNPPPHRRASLASPSTVPAHTSTFQEGHRISLRRTSITSPMKPLAVTLPPRSPPTGSPRPTHLSPINSPPSGTSPNHATTGRRVSFDLTPLEVALPQPAAMPVYKDRFCRDCGAQHPGPSAAFCVNCGTPRLA